MGTFAHGGKHDTKTQPTILAPGYNELSFDPPPAGSYQLPSLGKAADGKVLASDGSATSLSDLLGEKYTLMSFIFTSCSDINGCPLATFVMSQVAKRIDADPELANQVRFISLSFDPKNDTPQVMRNYGNNFRTDRTEWHFLTCKNSQDLQPILKHYGQSVAVEYNEAGEETGSYSHILRVYLIDNNQQIRNIYSVSFLHADTIINDLKTLMSESAPSQKDTSIVKLELHGAGDNKTGYESTSYTTKSNHLPNRQGSAQDLIAMSHQPPLGLPPMVIPADNPLSTTKVTLGRKLFFDRRLSLNQTISCAMCHVPEQGFTVNELATAVGMEGRTVRRNSPTIYNVGYMQNLFHDGRDNRLEHQVWQPLLATNEMANPSISSVIDKIHQLTDYDGLFEKAFAGESATIDNVGKAIASYERTLVSANSPFDRWYYGKDHTVLNDSAKRGFKLFTGAGQCSSCHLIGKSSALFTDHQLHNTGIGWERAMSPSSTKPQSVLIAPGIYINIAADAVADSAEKPPADLGRYEITQNPTDRWKYRTPSLRNVALTAPYMHDGSLLTLEEVIEFYNQGGVKNDGLDPLIKPLGLTSTERNDLINFLRALTGSNVDQILTDAFSAPVGNAKQQ